MSTGTAVIRGRVIDASGRPLARVEIRAGNGSGQQANGLTGADGRYDLNSLPAGTFTVSAAKANYVRSSWGEQRPEGPGKRITVADGQRIDNINFTLSRTGAITGRIVDEFGDPVTDVFVTAARYQYVQGTRRLMPSGRGSGGTNDLGEFRVYGLSPGQYYVSATLRNFAVINTDTTDRTGYAPTFYPGTGNPAEAQRIAVAAGQTIAGVNVTLLPIQTAKVSGTAVQADGKPFTVGMIGAMPKSTAGGVGMMMVALRPDGRFVINGLTPGEYQLRVNGPGAEESATADITVAGVDIDNVELVAVKPSTIRGRIAFTPSASSGEPPKPGVLDLGAARDWAIGQPVRNMAKIADDGTFEISLAAGRVQLRVAPYGAAGPNPNSWRLNRVLMHGVDVGDAGIDVPPNGSVDNVVVELTNRTFELSGKVTDADGATVRDCFVIVFAQDPVHWTLQTRYLSAVRPGGDDLYRARLLPGDYYAVAMSDVEPNAWTDAEFLAQARERAVKVTIGDVDKKTLDLALTPAPVY